MDLLTLSMMGMLPATQGGVNSGLMQQMRAMRYLRYGMGGGGRMRSGGGGQNPFFSQMQGMMEPDYSQFSFDPEARAAANKQLGQYGLHTLAPEEANPNALLPNSGFFGRHPGIARGIEGGIFGAAATRPSDTWGEGISNVAQGLIGGRQMRQGMINRQFAAPFEQAKMLEGLEDMSQKRDLNAAMIQWHQAQVEHLKNQPDKPDHPPVNLGPNTYSIYNNKTGEWEVRDNPNPKENPMGGFQGQLVRGRFGEPPEPGGPKNKKGLDSSQQYWDQVNNWMQGNKISVAGAGASAKTTATIKAEKAAGIDKSDKYKDAEWQHKQNLQQFDRKEYRDEVAARLMQQSGFKSMPTENDIDREVQKKKDALNKDFQATWGSAPSTAPPVRKFNQTTGTLE
jgi:hypothetical protein